jgi:hypothetical protein
LTFPYRLGDFISGELKTGGKYRKKSRDRDKQRDMTLAFTINDLGAENPDNLSFCPALHILW